jgi:hypothetical protein
VLFGQPKAVAFSAGLYSDSFWQPPHGGSGNAFFFSLFSFKILFMKNANDEAFPEGARMFPLSFSGAR